MAQQNGNEAVTVEDVQEAADLFMDAKASAQMLAENEDKFMKWSETPDIISVTVENIINEWAPVAKTSVWIEYELD